MSKSFNSFNVIGEGVDRGRMISEIKEKEKKQSETLRRRKQLVGYSTGEWTFRQIKLYHRYLSTHRNEFTDPLLRKRNKVFIKLADFIGSRTADQCRSHHQKTTKKFPQFDNLLKHEEQKIEKLQRLYEEISIEQKNAMRENLQEKDANPNEIEHYDIENKNLYQIKVQQGVQKHCEEKENGYGKDRPTDCVQTKDFYRLHFAAAGSIELIEIDAFFVQEYQ